jgi:tripartite-type tricarboxylate transporter receptor subunit TctC
MTPPRFTLTRRQALATAALVGAGWPLASPAQGTAPWPSKTITWVVPFPPGGVTDTTSRAIAKRLAELIGGQIVVENRPGAGGSTGTEAVSRAAADGYTMLFGTSGTLAARATMVW